MKKLIGITLLSAVAMLAAPKASKVQITPVPTTTTTTKKATKKAHVKKAKAAVKPAAAPTPSK